jgi:hypothetical protein
VQTLKRLHSGHATASRQVGDPPEVVPAQAYEFPVPNVDPVEAYRTFTRAWAPDALVLLHPELFAEYAHRTDVDLSCRVPRSQVRVGVAVFALAAAGLIRFSVRRPRLIGFGRILLQPVEGLTQDRMSPPSQAIWVSDLILASVYSADRRPPPGLGILGGLQGCSARAALMSGMATKHGWDVVPDPRYREASASAARILSHRWTTFRCDYTRLHRALSPAKPPSRSSGG